MKLITTPRIEEKYLLERLGCYDTDGDLIPEDAIKERLIPVVQELLTEAHQAGIDEAVEIVKSMKWKGEPPESAGDITWAVHKERNQALNNTIKALQDNK